MESARQKPNELIKKASAANHQTLEKQLILILKNIRHERDYFLLLSVFYNYFGALESKITPFITNDILPDFQQRRKAARIENDIKALGFELKIFVPVRLPEISVPLQALAALYVMEGSILGGASIVEMLHRKGIRNGVSFFAGYGLRTMSMWQYFLHVLNSYPRSDADVYTMTETVIATFDCFFQSLSELQNRS